MGASMNELQFEELGLRVGLEIHRQLDTANKLFCKCPTRLSGKSATTTFLRRLRPTQSEMGQIDPAALFEFHKGLIIIYESDEETSCLVEMDEEPPGELNPEAIEIGLTLATLLNSKILDEIHVMRKIVIDGSNTTGFQRTCLLAIGGRIDVDGTQVKIEQVCLEEDAARKVSTAESTVRYHIDRLGIPLLEVSTAPTIKSPIQAMNVAKAIGSIMKATGKVKRGLGSIRQDLNVSIREGALVEIKGVQELELIKKVVELEVQRQISLLEIKKELARRRVTPSDLISRYWEVTDIFTETKCNLIKKAISNGGIVRAVLLKGFRGLLGKQLSSGLSLGMEMSSRASFWGGVDRIFHTDELPAYGISQAEVDLLRERTCATELDCVVFVADTPRKVADSLEAVLERAKEALMGVPEETRMAMPDGTTRYMRPRPGSARMYPETDVPVVPNTKELLSRVRQSLPLPPEALATRLIQKYKINKKLAMQLVDSEYAQTFEKIASSMSIPASFVATVLTEGMKAMERNGIPVRNLSESQLIESFTVVDRGLAAKEAIQEILRCIALKEVATGYEAVKRLGLTMLSEAQLEDLIRSRVDEKLVAESGQAAFGKLMNLIMGEVRGRADPLVVREKLRKIIEDITKRHATGNR
jgi:glutamyl-tRNA(Gln) amidotransferase subunit E